MTPGHFILPLFVLLLLAAPAAVRPQALPYVEDVVGEETVEPAAFGGGYGNLSQPRLIGTFKLFNPDTVPFYLWISFENGGRFKHVKHAEFPSVRLAELELHYKNDLGQPIVKKFPKNRSEPRVKKRFGGAWLGGGRPTKRNSRGKSVDEDVENEAEVEAAEVGAAGNRRDRGRGASEITFWKEDAQGYYEMELWGVLYAPDVERAYMAGNYAEGIKFEIEAMK